MNQFWCGDELAGIAYMKSLYKPPEPPAGVTAKLVVPESGASAFKPTDYGWFEVPPLAYMNGNVAVIQIKGSLVPGVAGFRRLYNMTGYDEIRDALIEAAARADVAGILLHVDSPGGAVTGISSATAVIKEVKKLKPVVAYANNACSAGYWLASAADYLVADQMANVGSIGVVTQLVNYVDAHAKEGVKVHVFKSGSLKMAGNPNEEMSEEAKRLFEQNVADMAAIFYGVVAEHRKMSVDHVRVKFGDGRHMMAMRGYAEGLVDEVGLVGQAVQKLQQLVNSRGTNLPRL